MSGGSYGYIYTKIEEFADSLRVTTPERKVFRTLLYNVALAAHDIEWADSCDTSQGSETPVILTCIAEGAPLAEVIQDALRVREELTNMIEKAHVESVTKA